MRAVFRVLTALKREHYRFFSKYVKHLEKVKVGQILIPRKYEKKLRERALNFVKSKMAQGDSQLKEALAPLQAAVKEQVTKL